MTNSKIKIILILIIFVLIYFVIFNRRHFGNSLNQLVGDSTGQLINGKKQGEWRFYYSTGQLKEVSYFSDDIRNGKSISYFPNGSIEFNVTYKNGKFIDSFFWYHSNGRKNLEEFYDSAGKAQGIFKVYYDNGQLSQIGDNKNGKLNDSCIYFDRNGNQTKKEFYKNDSLISPTN